MTVKDIQKPESSSSLDNESAPKHEKDQIDEPPKEDLKTEKKRLNSEVSKGSAKSQPR